MKKQNFPRLKTKNLPTSSTKKDKTKILFKYVKNFYATATDRQFSRNGHFSTRKISQTGARAIWARENENIITKIKLKKQTSNIRRTTAPCKSKRRPKERKINLQNEKAR